MHSLLSFLRYHPQLVILPGSKVWQLQIDINILSASGGGNLHDVLSLAIRSAIWDLKIPKTRQVVYIKPGINAKDDEKEVDEDSGMKALLKGRKGVSRSGKRPVNGNQAGAADFELLDYEADGGDSLRDRENLPSSITLNLVGQQNLFAVWLH